MSIPTEQDIIDASKRINPVIHRTPVLTSQSINRFTGCDLFFKCENFQKVGAFKFRGASNTILQLSHDELKNGVATHSSGNHAQALALAAKLNKIPAFIVMPSNAPMSKMEAVLGYGARVIECEPTLVARETTLEKVVKETGAYFIHPYNDERIIAGQGTCAKELIEDAPGLKYILAPVGGGGLLSGTALSSYYFSPEIQVIGAEPIGADDAYRSLQKGEIIPSINPKTIADGLLTSLGGKTFAVIRKHVADILTVEEESIIEAMKLVWQRMKIIIEPSAAVPLAAIIKNKDKFRGEKVGIILSGGNIDFDKIPF